jgi:hypothetical protein
MYSVAEPHIFLCGSGFRKQGNADPAASALTVIQNKPKFLQLSKVNTRVEAFFPFDFI